VGYLLTGKKVHVWKTTDYGETWTDLGQISQATNPQYANAYGMVVTSKGTLLVADTDSNGGHLHRSMDEGTTWRDVGPVSTHALYRLVEVGDGLIVNGWAGHIYKNTDDGASWKDAAKLMAGRQPRALLDLYRRPQSLPLRRFRSVVESSWGSGNRTARRLAGSRDQYP
jgi:photosystem II stability/assembly factor-like uncharacterized protein